MMGSLHTATLLRIGGIAAALAVCAILVARDASALGVPPSTWAPGPPLLQTRPDSSTTLLPNGHLYVVGPSGSTGSGVYSAESFDPTTDTWTMRNPPPQVAASALHPLPDGTYLRAHRCDTGTDIYDPATDTWTAGPAMMTGDGARFSAALPGGRVLVVQSAVTAASNCAASGGLTAEVFEPGTGTWSAVPAPAGVGSPIPLSDGRVFLLSNQNQIFDGSTNAWSAAATRPLPGWYATAPLPDNRIMVAGGVLDFNFFSLKETYIYDATSDSWSDGPPMLHARSIFCLSPMPDGRVYAFQPDAEVYDPATNTWTPTGGLIGGQARATELPDGRLLAFGTCVTTNTSKAVQIFDTDTDGDGYNDWEEGTISEDAGAYCAIMRADLNHDRTINSGDQLAMAQAYFLQPYRPRVDQDGSATINAGDKLRLALQIAKTVSLCP